MSSCKRETEEDWATEKEKGLTMEAETGVIWFGDEAIN